MAQGSGFVVYGIKSLSLSLLGPGLLLVAIT